MVEQSRLSSPRLKEFLGIMVILLLVFFTFHVGIMNLKMVRPRIRSQKLSGGEPITTGKRFFLLTGIDSVEKTHRTDTIILAQLDFTKKAIFLLSIPRDTRVQLGFDKDGKETFGKINSAFARGGAEKLRVVLEALLGIEIFHYLVVDYKAFTHFIDIIGGVEITIEHEMHYDDNAGNLHIHFSKGKQRLTGQKALEYARFRHDSRADIGRIARQQGLIKSVFRQVKRARVLLRLPQIIYAVLSNVDSDATPKEFIDIGQYFINMSRDRLQVATLPGVARYVDKISYYLINEKTEKWLLDKFDLKVSSHAALKPTTPRFDEKIEE